jgi:hypothetical protein
LVPEPAANGTDTSEPVEAVSSDLGGVPMPARAPFIDGRRENAQTVCGAGCQAPRYASAARLRGDLDALSPFSSAARTA